MEFIDKEVLKAVLSCNSSKVPGPNGFNFSFIKKMWDLIKNDIITLMKDFWQNAIIAPQLNSTFLTLIPKVDSPVDMSEYRPISMAGSLYKILAKTLAS